MPTLPKREPKVPDLFSLKGKVALITGGTGHLGAAFSRALAEAGASVVVASRDQEKAAAFARKLPKVGNARHHGIELDHIDEKSCGQGFKTSVKAAGKVDILINNSLHRSSASHDLTNVTAEEFSRHQENNTGYFILSRIFYNHCVARKAPGSIIMIGSMYGVVGSYPDAYEGVSVASPVQYHVLKGGTVHMTRHLAVYWAKDNVRVNCISPGPFPIPSGIPDEMERRLCTKSPMHRMGLPHELKGALILFASEAGSYITGQNLLVDGGWTAW